jgi:RHS repeat-associated protein
LGNEDDGGLMYFHARYYAKELGRFMSCDPIKDMASSALTINPYVYCGNNPIVFKDPLGLRQAPGPSWGDDEPGGVSPGFGHGGFDTWGGQSSEDASGGSWDLLPYYTPGVALPTLMDAVLAICAYTASLPPLDSQGFLTELVKTANGLKPARKEAKDATYISTRHDADIVEARAGIVQYLESELGAENVVARSGSGGDLSEPYGTSYTNYIEFIALVSDLYRTYGPEFDRIYIDGHGMEYVGILFGNDPFPINSENILFPLAEGGCIVIMGCYAGQSSTLIELLEYNDVPYTFVEGSEAARYELEWTYTINYSTGSVIFDNNYAFQTFKDTLIGE